ncbi:MAG TPA: transporter substrate-binding domain-containing protein, partial [Actinomycetota bacterium]|nr:transporter substrate-binding domain-containing protein [Actinomycetota bacterium]
MKAGRWRGGALLGLVLAVVLVAAGCGDDGGDGGSTETTAGAGAAPAVDEALAAKVPDAIKSDGKLLIGTDPTYAPNEFLDTDGKTVVGFDVELFDAVAAKLGLETEWQPSKFADIIPGVQSGKYEAGVSSFTINDERKEQANMVGYFSAGTQWGAKTGNPAGVQPDDACGKKVAVQTGTVQETEDL